VINNIFKIKARQCVGRFVKLILGHPSCFVENVETFPTELLRLIVERCSSIGVLFNW
jgi:hypothetical protein